MALTLPITMPKKVRPVSEFGGRLMAQRTAPGLTQMQLAELIDSTQRGISRHETVADRAPAPVLAKLAKALRVTTDELLGLEPLRSSNGHDDPEARRLWKKFPQVMALPEKDRRAVIRLVNSLVETKGREASGGAR